MVEWMLNVSLRKKEAAALPAPQIEDDREDCCSAAGLKRLSRVQEFCAQIQELDGSAEIVAGGGQH